MSRKQISREKVTSSAFLVGKTETSTHQFLKTQKIITIYGASYFSKVTLKTNKFMYPNSSLLLLKLTP